MASLRSLGFSIFSTYDGSGVTRARNDINSLSRDIDRNRQSLVTQAITLRALSKISLSALATSAAAVAPALFPITKAAASAAGAFTAMSVSAGSAMGIYGVVMHKAVTSTYAAGQELKRLRSELGQKRAELAKLTPGTKAYADKLKEVQQAQSALRDMLRELSPAQEQFIKATDGMTAAWYKFLQSGQAKTLQTATDVVKGLTVAIPKMTAVIDAVHPAIKRTAVALRDWLSGPGFERFVKVIIDEGVPALEALLSAGRHVLTFLGNGFRAFAPEGTKLAETFREGARALAEWSNAGGFERFIARVRENGPQMREFFRALGDALKNVKAALDGLGMPALMLATALLRIVAAMPPSWIQAFLVGWMMVRTVMLGMAIVQGVSLMFNALAAAMAFVRLQAAAFAASTIAIRIGLLAMAVGAKLAAAATFMLSGAFLASPIFWVVAAIAALVAAIVLIATKTTWFQTAWEYTWNFIKEVADRVWGALKTAWQAVVNFFKAVWDVVGEPLKAAWNAVWTFMSGLVQGIWISLQQLWSAFITAIIAIWNVIGPVLSAAWSVIWTVISGVATGIWITLQQLWSAFITAIIAIWNVIGPVLSAAWSVIWTVISTVATVIWTALQMAWQIFINAIIAIWNVIGPVLQAAWSVIWTVISTVATVIWTALQMAWQVFINAIIAIWNVVGPVLQAAWNVIWTVISTVATTIWNVLQTLWNAFVTNGILGVWNVISAALSAAWNAIWNAISTAAQAIWTALQAAWNAFLTAVQTVWNTISGALSAAWDAAWNAIRTVAETIWNALQAAWQAFLTAVRAAYDAFMSLLNTAWNAAWNVIKTVAETIWTALQTAWQTFVTAVRAIYDAFMSLFTTAWRAAWELISSVAREIWDFLNEAWDNFTEGIKDIWEAASEWIKDKWSDTWNAVENAARSIWNRIADVIEGAVNGVIKIINALTGGFNKVAGFLGIDIEIGDIGEVKMPRFAAGGVVEFAYGGMTGSPQDMTGGGALSGYAPGRDTIPAILSRGEGVLTPEAVRGLGGAGFVNGANKTFAGHRGAGKGGSRWQGSKFDTGPDNHRMFAKGGMVDGMVPFAVGGMTADALRRAGVSLGMVSQGEYSNGRLSAGTHAGGGVVDISSTSSAVVARLRAAGFAAWARTGPAWAGNEHIHAVLMNHPALSGPARAQVASFRAGGNGLGAGGGDGGGGGGGAPAWLEPLLSKAGEIISRVAQGLDISGIFNSIFGGGGGGGGDDDKENGKGLFGLGFGPDVGPDLTPGKDLGDAVGKGIDLAKGYLGSVMKLAIPGFGPLGKFMLGLIPDDAFEFGFKWLTDRLAGFVPGAGGLDKFIKESGNRLAKGAIKYLIGKNQDAAPEKAGMFSGGGGAMGDPAAVKGRWGAMAAQALARAGISAGQLDRFLALMHAESGGNPGAANLWDSNAKMGQASRGLMQVIPSTFAAYRDKSLPNNILDPMANMVASARYIKAKYGGNVPGSPYAKGTDNATPGAHLVGEKGPELVTAPGYAMFGGGEQVLNAADTAAALAPPALPSAGTSAVSAATTGGGGAEDPLTTMQQLMEAAERMSEVVMTAWNEAISSGKTGQGALASVHQALVAEMGTDVPGSYNIMRAAAATAWAAINAQTTAAWTVMRDGVYAEAQLMQGTTMPLANQAMTLANGVAWQQMNAATTTEWGLMRDTTFTEANDFIAVKMPAWADEMDQAVSTSFQFMNEATAESWEGMQDATRAPVNWIITNAYNNGLARLWNEVAEVIFEDGARTLPTVATLAKGGPVSGPGTATSDSIPARLSDGEHVWTAREVRAAGGHGAVQALRSGVLGGRRVRGAHAGCGFAKGGWNPGSDSMSGSMGLPGLGELKRGFMMDEAEPFLDAFDSGARANLESNNFKQMGAIADALSPSDWIRQYIEKDDELNRIGSGGPPWIPGVSDVRTSWGGVAVNQRTADMLNMAMSLGASFSATQGSWSSSVAASAGTHSGGGVVDLVPANNTNVGALRAVGFAAWNRGAAWGSPSFSPHIHAVALGDPTVSGAAAAQIMSYLGGGNGLAGNGPDNFGGGIPSVDGVQAIGGGGQEVDPADLEQRVVAFDKGGWIMPGQFAYNGTGRPELATPADDIARLAASVEGGGMGGECIHLEFNFNGPVSNEQDVRKAIDDAIPKLRRAIQAGTGKRAGG